MTPQWTTSDTTETGHSLSDYLRFEKYLQLGNKSEHTLKNYQRDLSAFVVFYLGDYLGQELDEKQVKNNQAWLFLEQFSAWNQVKTDAIRAFVSHRMLQGVKATTIARQLSSIRSLYDYLISEDLAQMNPAKGVKAPKGEKPLPKSLDVDLTQQLLDQSLETWQDIRNQAVFELLYSAGLRVSELAEMDMSPSLDSLSEGWVRVLGKGQKEREAPVGRQAKTALDNWLSIRQEHAKSDEQAVFVNKNGRRLSVRSIQSELDKRALKAGLPTKMSPHRLRHACATHVLESSGDLRAVQEMLGHANLSTTQIYTKLDLQHLAKVYDGAHPRAKKKK